MSRDTVALVIKRSFSYTTEVFSVLNVVHWAEEQKVMVDYKYQGDLMYAG